LRSKGLPHDRTAALHESTGTRVRVGQQLWQIPNHIRGQTRVHPRTCCLLHCHRLDYRTSTYPGIEVGLNSFTNLVYADDTALFLPHDQDSTEILSSFCSTEALLGSWAKTKLQNVGSGPRPAAISVSGNLFKPVDTFVYLSSLQSSDGY